MTAKALTCSMIGSLLLLSLFVESGSAQRASKSDSIAAVVRGVVVAINRATVRGDWDALQKFFPPSSGLSAAIEKEIRTPNRDPLSFWRRDVTILPDSIVVKFVAPDIAAIQVPFHMNGTGATWGAVLIGSSEGWRVHCAREAYGGPQVSSPGCVSERW